MFVSDSSSLAHLADALPGPPGGVMRRTVADAFRGVLRGQAWQAARDIYRTGSFGSMLAGHLAVLRSKRRLERALGCVSAQESYRYLRRHLADGLTVPQRRTIILHHQATLADYLETGARRFPPSMTLWATAGDDGACAILLSLNGPRNPEGEMRVVFALDGHPVYKFSLTLAPGGIFGLDDRSVLFVGQVQGGNGALPGIKRAANACGGVSPALLTMTAIERLAAALGATALVGVSTGRQAIKSFSGTNFSFDYDRFWIALGFRPRDGAYYVSPLPIPHKPLETVSAHHRRRARSRRQYREAVGTDVAAVFAGRAKRGCQLFGDG